MIISAFNKALTDARSIIDKITIPINVKSDNDMLSLIKNSTGTKVTVRWSDPMCKLALEAVRTVSQDAVSNKIPGGEIEQS